MDDTLLFIPPCCVDKKLPKALTQAPHRTLTFFTHGDVVVEKFYRAVSYMLIDPHVMVLSLEQAGNDVLTFLSLCFDRGWISSLVLLTRHDETEGVRRFLGGYVGRVLYVVSKDVTDAASHMVLYNDERALELFGPMYARGYNGVCLAAYHLVFYPSYCLATTSTDWGHPLRNALLPDVLAARKVYGKAGGEIVSDLHRFLRLEFPPYTTD